MRITAVPLHQSDLVRRAGVNGFTLTEAWSPARPIPMHAHGTLSITILLAGTFRETYQPVPSPHVFQPGSLVIRPAGEAHANELGAGGARTLSIELEPARLELYGAALGPFLSLSHRRETEFLDIGRAMSNELCQADRASGLALESLSLELLARLLRISDARDTGPIPQWLKRTRASIEDRFREQSLRISGLASEVGVHPVYFARAFRHAYRTSPGEYVRRLRIEWAREQLLTTSLSLAAIALECGFADQSHFTRAFRAYHGMAPGRLRRQIYAAPQT
jgi:AraC family transcriptional regulator